MRCAAHPTHGRLPSTVQALGVLAEISLLLSVTVQVAAFDVAVHVGGAHAKTDIASLTSVTMDVCVCKQNFPFTDPTLLALTSHLGGGASILRIGGSDQNSFYYDVNSTKTHPYSAKTGEKCCKHPGSCHGCADDCTMPAPYWAQIVEFAKASGHKLMFGLVPDVGEASALVSHSARNELAVYAYTFGNEKDTPQVIAGYPRMRRLLSDRSVFPVAGTAPRLAGPDVALQRHATIDEALRDQDETILDKLGWVANFSGATGDVLDVVSWHTYDFHTSDIGMEDHSSLRLTPETPRLWSTVYLDLALRLAANVSSIARRNAPRAEVWLSESDSICHQGVHGVTNAYLNSLWLVNRLGLMANANFTVMARQSLVGYNYSLLGNWPVEPIAPNPDYFTTLLFQRLFGDTVLLTSAKAAASPPPANPKPNASATKGGDRARAFAFCAGAEAGAKPGAVAVAMINFDAHEPAVFGFPKSLGATHDEYLLAPGADPVVAAAPWSSRQMLLNGEGPLRMGASGALPAAVTGGGKRSETSSVTLTPLTVGFALFPEAAAADCMSAE